MTLSLLDDTTWQMTYGERFALEGVVSGLRPELAIEIGTAEGGSLRRIAAHAREVHCFDLAPAVADVVAAVPNAVAHIGDSRETLPAALGAFAAAGRHVDFALVDGDHSADGVRRDTEALLRSPACRRTVIVLHDTANDEVRRGLELIDLPRHPKVALCMLDMVPGHVVVEDHVYSRQSWNGLGLVVLDPERGAAPAVTDVDHEDTPLIHARARERSAPAPGPGAISPTAGARRRRTG
jgi:hypothetical protein